jgi:hypothetical protein
MKLRTGALGVAILLAAAALVTVGCASTTELHRKAVDQASADREQAGTMLSPLVGNPPEGFLSTAYVGGTAPTRIGLDHLDEAATAATDRVRVRVVVPEGFEAAFDDFRQRDDESIETLLASVAATLSRASESLYSLPSGNLEVVFLAAPAGSGVVLEVEDRLDDGALTIAIANPYGRNTAPRQWMLNGLTFAAHELLHAHYRLVGIRKLRFQEQKRINEETAAYLFGWCAGVRGQHRLGSEAARFEFSADNAASMFPSLGMGRYCPERHAIRALGTPSEAGRTMALAAMRIANPDLVFAVSDPESTRALHSICEALPAGIPDFLDGDIPGLHARSDCRD